MEALERKCILHFMQPPTENPFHFNQPCFSPSQHMAVLPIGQISDSSLHSGSLTRDEDEEVESAGHIFLDFFLLPIRG